LWHFDVNARQTRIRTMGVDDVNENKNIGSCDLGPQFTGFSIDRNKWDHDRIRSKIVGETSALTISKLYTCNQSWE
jgi:hypothetical protein